MSAILKAMHAVMSEVGAIEKSRTNPQQNYKFRGIDEVLEALQPLFVKHGIICTQEVTHESREMLETKSGGRMASVRLRVLHTYRAVEDGSFITATTLGEAMDSGDKASNKAMAAALKYAHCFSFTIPTREPELDTETDSPEVLPQSGRVTTAPATKPAQRTAASQPTVPPPQPGGRTLKTHFPNFGRSKGAPIAGASQQDLAFYRNSAMRSLNDASKSRFHEAERALIEAIDLELSRQASNEPPPPSDADSPPF